MVSENLTGIIEHKKQVALYMRLVVDALFRRAVEFGEVIPFHLETDDEITLMDMIDIACKLKRDGYCKFYLSGQLENVVKNTIEYLADCKDSTACSWLEYIILDLFQRAIVHDNSKFSPEEFDAFEEATPRLKEVTYGSDEYRAELKKIKPAIQHHYQVNRHHVEFHEHGINGMTLIDLIEMVCDWIAATKRSKDGNIDEGLVINKKRFDIDDQLYAILKNTVEELSK